MRKVTVTGSKTYDIIIEKGCMERVGELAKQVIGVGKSILITDDIVDGLYGTIVETSLRSAGFDVVKYVIPNGERSKNGYEFLKILNYMAENELTRSDAVFALGGGVVGDLAGFSAASYMRGIKLVQIPTTLLAMVDSSVGGKTAIDLPAGKNLVGAFYQPDLVLCDLTAAETLPDAVFADGCAEIIKYGMICDEEMLEKLEGSVHEQIGDIVERCVSIKRDVVNEDEHDHGLRQLLNFGHTPAHAIEQNSNYTISHGRAVAIGMAMITRACLPEAAEKLEKLIEKYDLPTETDYTTEQLVRTALSDKKRKGNTITLVVPEKYGRCELKKITIDEIAEYFRCTKKQ